MNIGILMPENNVARKLFITSNVVTALESLGTLTWNKGTYAPEYTIPILNNSDIVVTGWGIRKLDDTVLAGADKLKLVVHTGGSVAGFVSDYMFERGIRVMSGNKAYAESVAEGTVAYMMAILRRIPEYSRQVQEGGWAPPGGTNRGLLDKTVGLLGFGAIAQYLAPMLRPFRCKVQAYDPYVRDEIFDSLGVTRAASIEELFTANEIISVHLPMQPETNDLINKTTLACLQDGAVLINTARGNCIVEEDLAAELKTGRISAVLDVYKQEPLPMESPLRGMDNCILMPHHGGPTSDRHEYVTMTLVEDIKRFIAGQPLDNEIPKEYAVKMTKEY